MKVTESCYSITYLFMIVCYCQDVYFEVMTINSYMYYIIGWNLFTLLVSQLL